MSDKIKESDVITSFILRPTDGGKVIQHKPGQYLTFALAPQGRPPLKRNYSISCAPNDKHYRISVKREANGLGGSRYLHDEITIGAALQVTPPAGDFILPHDQSRPVILLSGGVGLTPMVSMIEALAGRRADFNICYIHGALNGATHAMDAHVRAIAQKRGRTSVTTFYSHPTGSDVLGKSHDLEGLITIDWLTANTPLDDADIFICGPRPFLHAMIGGLTRTGVTPERIHYEFFGPADEVLGTNE